MLAPATSAWALHILWYEQYLTACFIVCRRKGRVVRFGAVIRSVLQKYLDGQGIETRSFRDWSGEGVCFDSVVARRLALEVM